MSTPLPALLRARLAAPLAAPLAGSAGALAFGDPRVDGCLPGGAGLPLGQLHEIGADGIEAETGGLTAAFAACWLARLLNDSPRPVLWIAAQADLYPPGLLAYGLNPARLLLVHSGSDTATLAAMEAALRGGAAAAVVGEAGALPRLAGRRLHLACLAHGSTGFVLRRWPHGVKQGAREAVGVATRWHIATAPSRAEARAPGPPRWQVALTHARGGRPGSWLMELDEGDSNAPTALRVVAGLADPAGTIRRRA